jgi:glycosyltransferase involved in cell wall biosynthesis
VKVRRYDIVHAFSASYTSYVLAPLPAMIVAKFYGRATVLNYRSGEADDHLKRWRITAVPTMCRFADRIVVPSEYLVEVFRSHGLRARAIHNFVPLERIPYRRRTAVRPMFLSNRNLESLYNVECTIRAFALVHAQFPDAKLTIAGDGSERRRLQVLAEHLGLFDSVRFVGRVSNEAMDALYQSADIYLNSPNIDNMPGSVLEAFAAGIPVVTTDAGGIPFIVRDGVNGRMVPVADYEGMARAIVQLLREDCLALKLADAARSETERLYTWTQVKVQWERLYRSLLESSASRDF